MLPTAVTCISSTISLYVLNGFQLNLRILHICIPTKFLHIVHFTGGVVLSSKVVASPTSLTISWMVAEPLTAHCVYNISYRNTNNTRCFTDSKNVIGRVTDTRTILTDLQEDTLYSITLTIVGYGTDSITATTMAAG